MSDAPDLLILHVPKFHSHYRPYGDFMSVNLIPMGTWGLADLAEQGGHRTRILHLGIEWIQHGQFSAARLLRSTMPKVVALPLHWHQQSYDVLRIVEEVRELLPEAFILLGGYTASFYHREIMDVSEPVDGILRGDGEGPLPALLDALRDGRPLDTVPNLTWRQDDRVIANPLTYTVSEKELAPLSFARLDLLEDREFYIRHMGLPFIWSRNLSPARNHRHFHLGLPLFPLNIGRGCSGNCTWCGGGAVAQQKVNGRRGVVFRSPESVVETACDARAAGYTMLHIAFDPGREGERYYQELLPLMEQRCPGMACYFESFSVPSPSFFKAFIRAFEARRSIIAVSPESGVERIRARNKSFAYTNDQLMASLAEGKRARVGMDCFFAMGIPGEKAADLATTAALRRRIRRRFSHIRRIWTSPISLEPASPWYFDPKGYGIVSQRGSFVDFLKASGPDGGGLGYYIHDYFPERGLLDGATFESFLKEEKCRHHCSFHPNPLKNSRPFMGRIHCRSMARRTGGRLGRHSESSEPSDR